MPHKKIEIPKIKKKILKMKSISSMSSVWPMVTEFVDFKNGVNSETAVRG
jgi:hypothetical protein